MANPLKISVPARRFASEVLTGPLSVCLSVRLPQAGTVSKRLNGESRVDANVVISGKRCKMELLLQSTDHFRDNLPSVGWDLQVPAYG